MELRCEDPAYPENLRRLTTPPKIYASGPLGNHIAVGIAGSRHPTTASKRFATELAGALARAGVVVVSGGAVGVDRAAHEGALDAGGVTWVVAPNGSERPFPPENKTLFKRVAASEASRMIWPFAPSTRATKDTLKARNGILVGLSEAVVVIQAKHASGSRNTIGWARVLRRPLWIVPGVPGDPAFAGSNEELRREGAHVFLAMAQLFEALRLPPPKTERPQTAAKRRRAPRAVALLARPGRAATVARKVTREGWSDQENLVFSAISLEPRHTDDLAERTGLSAGQTATALLTLALKDVVVEGPDGFFRLDSCASGG